MAPGLTLATGVLVIGDFSHCRTGLQTLDGQAAVLSSHPEADIMSYNEVNATEVQML